jgi:hypothetical protein
MFRLTLPSNASMNYFPDNTLSNFTIKPPVPIVGGEDYECALSKIIFPNRFINVRTPNNSAIVRRNVGSEEEQEANKKTFTVPTGSYETISELLKAIRDAGVDGIVKRKALAYPISPSTTATRGASLPWKKSVDGLKSHPVCSTLSNSVPTLPPSSDSNTYIVVHTKA